MRREVRNVQILQKYEVTTQPRDGLKAVPYERSARNSASTIAVAPQISTPAR